MATFQVKTKVR